MTGVILAGGEGTRMSHLLNGHNKHAYEVSGQPMIYYPLNNLKEMGCDAAVVITSPQGMLDLTPLLENYGMDITYKVQEQPNGSAAALGLAEGIVEGVFPVLCGDTYFNPPLPHADTPTLFWHDFELGHLHSVWDPETNEIIEKPLRDIGKRAIIGYYYDERIFDVIRSLKPSARGEIELVDLHRFYVDKANMVEYKGFFGDMGTPEGLKRVEEHIASYFQTPEYKRLAKYHGWK